MRGHAAPDIVIERNGHTAAHEVTVNQGHELIYVEGHTQEAIVVQHNIFAEMAAQEARGEIDPSE